MKPTRVEAFGWALLGAGLWLTFDAVAFVAFNVEPAGNEWMVFGFGIYAGKRFSKMH